MKSAVFFVLISALAVCADKINPNPFKSTRTKFHPNKFIVEVDSTYNLRRRVALHPLDAVYHEFKSRAVHVQVTKEFKMDGIFNGATVIVNDAEHLSLIKNTPGVKAIRQMRTFPRPTPIKYSVLPRADANTPDKMSTHILTGVDKVHAEGNTGVGVKIGIIDTGIDYNHPALGSNGFGPNKKIVTGYDFVGDNLDNPQPKADPMDCDGHGTHVAGILAADPGNLANISGVAYGATFGAYKIFGCTGGTSEELIIQALLQAVKDGMDIITLSLGESDGWSISSSGIVASQLVQNGKIITMAAGNEGEEGSWDASAPASGRGVLSIGSVDNTMIPLQNATVQGVDHPPITYFSGIPLKINGALSIYATSTNTTIADDACSPLANNTPDLSKLLVVIRSGSCNFTTKLSNAAAKGARAVFIYETAPGLTRAQLGNSSAMIQAADGEFLVKQFAAGAQITVSFPQVGGSTNFPDSNGGLMSYFSTFGPTFDFEFKPTVSAPGGSILSTFPNENYAVLSGTSMSTPFVAGAAALLLAASNKTLPPNSVQTLLETTSTKINVANNNPGFDTLVKAGAGLINVYNAIHSKTLVSPGELVLNDSAHFQGERQFIVQNAGTEAKEYTVKHSPALTAMSMQNNSLPSLGPVPLVSTFATADISPQTFTIEPGKNQTVAVKFTPPKGLDTSRYPVYSGFIEVTSGQESLHVSYIGLAANLKDHKLFDNTTSLFPFPSPSILRLNGPNILRATPIVQLTTFTFDGADYPSVFMRLAMGTPALHVDLVAANFQLATQNNGSFADMPIIGRLASQDYIGRNDRALFPFYNLELKMPRMVTNSTTVIPNGQYRIIVRALKITGDATVAGDYETWLSPIIGINA